MLATRMRSRNYNDLLLKVLASHSDSDKWRGAPFEKIKRVSNSLVGKVGQEFVERVCELIEFDCEFPLGRDGRRSNVSPWDIKIEGVAFELKTATEDVGGAFQFNHIRYHRPYDAVLCLGISPDSIHYECWTKAEITTGKAGSLVTMEKGANASYKLTKKPSQLRGIETFEDGILDLVAKVEADK